jgi:hypothetical protein
MRITLGRWSRLAALGAGVAAAVAVATTAAGPALADTVDTGGTASISLAGPYALSLAKAGIVVFASGTATSSWNSNAVSYSLSVNGGTGEVSNFFGFVNLGGKLRVVNAKNGKAVVLSGLSLSFDTGVISAKPVGGTGRIALADVGGNLSTDTSAGPPPTETFSCDGLTLDSAGARYLDSKLMTTAFKAGDTLGGFTTTFTVTIT